jgi:dimethylamine/trimethylamine dehydrogenase
MGEEWRRGWHPERIRSRGSEAKVLVVGAGPAGLEAAMMLGRRGYEVMLAEASRELGGRVLGEARLPGLAAWIRVVDYRVGQLERLSNVEQARESTVDADDVFEFGFEHVAVATGAHWRADGVGRWHTRPLDLDGVEVLTPDDLVSGVRPAGKQVVLFDDDHYYLGGALAELLAGEGFDVTLATPAARVSEWTVNTMEQERIQRRLLESGVTLAPGHTLTAPGRLSCVYTEREREVPCDALVLVTARLPLDALAIELHERRSEWDDAGLRSVQAVGDAFAPGTIATAVWDGRRFAEELDGETPGDAVPFRREVVALAEQPVHTVRR